jgi:hypothetical protein
MRTLHFVLSLVVVATAAAVAENKAQTEAQRDGLNGPVHSVSLIDRKILFNLDPAEAWIIQNVVSEDVEYDSQGYWTKMGRLDASNGEFLGQMSEFVRDANGRVLERMTRQLPSMELLEQDAYGPFGLQESTSFSSSKPSAVHKISYDQYGNVREDIRIDGDLKPIFRTLYKRNPDGNWTERTTWLKGRLHSHETYDPDSDFQRYEEYGESGNVTTSFTHSHGRVESYWSASNDANGGLTMVDNLNNGDIKLWRCHDQERTCDGSTRHAIYLDAERHNPSIAEVSSDDGRLRVRAYYEYEMDGHGNWTRRKVWVQSGEQGNRTLYETDSRTITYWPE